MREGKEERSKAEGVETDFGDFHIGARHKKPAKTSDRVLNSIVIVDKYLYRF